MRKVCEEKNLDAAKYEFRHPGECFLFCKFITPQYWIRIVRDNKDKPTKEFLSTTNVSVVAFAVNFSQSHGNSLCLKTILFVYTLIKSFIAHENMKVT